jgi:hypothetical protein
MQPPGGTYYEGLNAAIAYWLSRGDTQAQALTHFRERFGSTNEDLFWNAIANAERGANVARAFRELNPLQTLEQAVGPTRALGQIYRIRFNVAVPVPGGGFQWLATYVEVTGNMTQQQIEALARQQVQRAYSEHGRDYNVKEGELPEEDVVQVGGIFTV